MLPAVSKGTPENTRNKQSHSTFNPGMAEEYIPQVSEEIERWVTENLSQKFSWTESRVLGALPKLDEFLLNPQVRTCSVAVPGTFSNNNSENRDPTGDRSLNDPCPEVEFSDSRTSNLTELDQDERHHSTSIWRHISSVQTGI